jgi:hypothetical protein
MDPIERRDFLKGTATGVFAFTVGGVAVLLSPRDARAQNVPFRLPQRRRGPNHRGIGRDARPRRACGGHRSFRRSAAFCSAARPLDRDRQRLRLPD